MTLGGRRASDQPRLRPGFFWLTPCSHDGNVVRMTERDWEATARNRLEKVLADVVYRIRKAADEIERDAKRNVANAAQNTRVLEFQTYPRVAGQVVHALHALLFNLPLENLIDAAADAEAARTENQAAEKVTGDPDSQAGRILALAAVGRAAKGWANNCAQEEIDRGIRDRKSAEEQEFRLADILNMIDDAAREVGVAPVYGTMEP